MSSTFKNKVHEAITAHLAKSIGGGCHNISLYEPE